MRTVPHGITVTKRFDPAPRDTAAAVGNAGVDAVATVALILRIEAACGDLMAPYLEAGEAGVGCRVAVDHTGPAFAGRPVEVSARVGGVDGRKVAFAVRLAQDGREVMTGEHVRAVVDLARFLGGRANTGKPAAGPPTQSPARPPVTFFFDVHSPWSYDRVARDHARYDRDRRNLDRLASALPDARAPPCHTARRAFGADRVPPHSRP